MRNQVQGLPSVLVIGQATVDRVHVGDDPKGSSIVRPGGKALNQAVAYARLGMSASIATAVGSDEYGLLIRSLLRVEGVGQDYVLTASAARGPEIPSVRVELTQGRRSQRRVSVHTDKRLVRYFDTAVSRIGGSTAQIVALTFEFPDGALLDAIENTRRLWSEGESLLVVNPAPAREFSVAVERALGECDLLTPNRSEAAALLQRELESLGPEEDAAEEIRQMFGAKRVCITLGDRGVACAINAGTFTQMAFPLSTHDKVGASDVFTSAVSSALAVHAEFRDAVQFGVVCAGIAVSRPNGLESFPTLDEVSAVLSDVDQDVWRGAITACSSMRMRSCNEYADS